MTVLFFALSVCFLTAGHLLKALRWRQFTEIYEDTPQSVLNGSLAAGYLVSFFFPFRLGDVLRVVLAGRRMKNGFGYALATVIVDRILDVFSVAVIFFVMSAASGFAAFGSTTLFYAAASAVLLLISVGSVTQRRWVKRRILAVGSIFADPVKFHFLAFFWSLITSFKDLWYKLRKGRLLRTTILMWAAYLLSYSFMSAIPAGELSWEGTSRVFELIFARGSLMHSTFFLTASRFSSDLANLIGLSMLLSLLLILLSALLRTRRRAGASPGLALLPQREIDDKLRFLNLYFESDKLEMLEEFLQANRDVSIVRDVSAGSDATTMLCLGSGGMIYRKFSFGDSAAKLLRQAQWLQAHSGLLPLARILDQRQGKNSFAYDMPVEDGAISLFDSIYARPVEQSWALLEQILNDLDRTLYSPPGEVLAARDIARYVEDKVSKNLDLLRRSSALRALMQAERLSIGGQSCRGLPQLARLLDPEKLRAAFAGERRAPVHGDLTVENVVAYTNRAAYYLIDPNPDCPISTPALDYSKLLQSLHGHYELIRYAHSVTVRDGEISFFIPDSTRYDELWARYDAWLRDHFPPEELRAIYLHELIHWLRLLPYKLKKNDKNLLVYFARFVILLNDIDRMFGDML